MCKEEWRSTLGFTGYEVSSKGRVRSIDRCVRGPYNSVSRRKGKLLKLSKCSDRPYVVVNIQGKPRFVHVLVMTTFVGKRPVKHDVAHLDGNPINNKLLNLKYVTRSENNYHITLHGNRKLTVEQVLHIRKSAKDFVFGDQKRLELELRLAQGTIYSILKGRLYSHVK